MMSTKAQIQNQSQQSIIDDEHVFNAIDSTSYSLPNNNIGQITSTVDAEQDYSYHSQGDQRYSSTNDVRKNFDRFPLRDKNSSASSFCGETTDGPSALHSSSRPLLNSHHHRPSSLTRPYLTSSSIRLPLAALITTLSMSNTNGCQRSSSPLLTNHTSNTTDHQPCFTNYLPTTRLPSIAPTGSYDQIVDNTNTIAPFTSIDIMSQLSSASSVFFHNTSITDAQPPQFAKKIPTTTFCYVSAFGSLVYNNLTGTSRPSTVRHQ